MKKSIVRVALKDTIVYLILLVILSMGIAYVALQISLYIKYAIDGILFNDYNDIPIYIYTIFKHNYVHDLAIIAIMIIVLNIV